MQQNTLFVANQTTLGCRFAAGLEQKAPIHCAHYGLQVSFVVSRRLITVL
jgi:hypothetical protein